MLHYGELLVKYEHRLQFSFQTFLLAHALRERGKWSFGWASRLLPHWIWKTHQTLLQELLEQCLLRSPFSQVRIRQSCTSLSHYVQLICQGLSVSSDCSQLLLWCSQYCSPALGSAPSPLDSSGAGEGTVTTPKSTTWKHHWTLLQGVSGCYLTLPKMQQAFPEEL